MSTYSSVTIVTDTVILVEDVFIALYANLVEEHTKESVLSLLKRDNFSAPTAIGLMPNAKTSYQQNMRQQTSDVQ